VTHYDYIVIGAAQQVAYNRLKTLNNEVVIFRKQATRIPTRDSNPADCLKTTGSEVDQYSRNPNSPTIAKSLFGGKVLGAPVHD